ncbi:calcium channel protein [Pseudocyphellaria aurata]|nr:calcium channel protein [Pseudocyphellaria aurata]
MSSNRSSPRNYTRRQSIPLQDLSRPPDSPASDSGRLGPSRSIHERARSLLGTRHSFSGRSNTSYERVDNGSPTPRDRNLLDLPPLPTPRSAHQPAASYEDGEISPVNINNFQDAMGSVGLSFPSTPSVLGSASSVRTSTLDVITETEPISPSSQHPPLDDENSEGFPLTDLNDSTPLKDPRYLQPISGNNPLAQRHDRQNSHFSFQERPSLGSRLGDDLPNGDGGLGRSPSSAIQRRSSRTLSISATASPLSRAGSMMRKMSQRVVNLSNEPEIVEQSIRRQPSSKHARLEEPPSFPAMTEYAHDEPQRSAPQIDKSLPLITTNQTQGQEYKPHNPLRGNSLFIFSPDSWIRLKLCEMLVHPVTEPVILVLIVIQTILLAVDSAPTPDAHQMPKAWGDRWINIAMLALFSVYTVEIAARIIVSGLFKNADEYSTIDSSLGFKNAVLDKIQYLFAPQRQQPTINATNLFGPAGPQPSILRSFTGTQAQATQTGNSRQQQRNRLARRAFLRHSFNRLDLLAVVSYWFSFVLALTHVEQHHHLFVFRMLSCLRLLRLLGLTSGTMVILRSLKKAAPLLVNVAFLIGFFWLLFAIIGVQSFKSSFRRTCVWYENMDFHTLQDDLRNHKAVNNYTLNIAPQNIQFCGGYLNDSGAHPWLKADLINEGARAHKGYLCPNSSLCVENSNPYNGTVSFDDVLHSLQMVFVIMSSNTFSDLMYYTMDSDFLAAALFFAFGIVIMSFWLMNLLVAVITSSFQVIREESKTSAFTTDELSPVLEEDDTPEKISAMKRAYDKTSWVWIVIIVFGLVFQSLRSARMHTNREDFINRAETVITIVLCVEIVLRFVTDWRNFHRSRRNWVDLSLAIITAIIQLPPIHLSGQAYFWMTFFQIFRIYRVVLAVPLTRDLIMVVLGNVTGLLNLIVFVFLITFLTAIFAVQIYRGEFPTHDVNDEVIYITFANIYNSFIGMYQVLSSENWTTLMYNATQYEQAWGLSWIGVSFFILWFILANFIILNMFIAVIQENFDVTEDEKRLQQVKAFLQQKELGGSSHGNLSLSTIFKLGRDSARHKDPLDYGPATMEMLLKDAVVRDFLDEQLEPADDLTEDGGTANGGVSDQVQPGLLSRAWSKLRRRIQDREPNPFYSRLKFSRAYEELDPRTMAKEVVSATEQRKRAQRQYLQKHPTYNVSMFLFKPNNIIRRVCQRIVGPGRGSQRIEGLDPVKPVWYAFSAFIYAAIVAMVLLACVSTPLYQREYFDRHGGETARSWFVWTDMGFAVVFTIEAIIKVIADGFFWTPNAYFRGSWGFIDGLVLVTLWINVLTSLYKDGGVSRAVGAFKALRALRLLNVSDSARDTFHSVIILGGWKVVSSSFVSLSLLVPFAIYGLNLFNGQMLSCNDMDPSITLLDDCVGEYNSTPYNWNVLAPTRVANPYYNFDNFGNSLFILFQIVSQEGWIDVMWQAMSINGKDNQPQDYKSQGNAIFFIIFNLLGAVFVLTLFVSVFMRNYTEQTGVAFLTADQRSWLELRKLLRQISPSKRPSNKSEQGWKAWCYRIAVKKHGKWQRFLTAILFVHLLLLVLEFYPEGTAWQKVRDFIFLAFTVLYIANIVVRVIGLSWKRFRRSSWDLYSIVSVTGTLTTTLLDFSMPENWLYSQLHKLFLVSIALLLIPRNNQLDQLFKTAAASLTAIGNLLATWFVLFLVYAIALTQTFGLTRFGSMETGNLNFRNVPKALILLFRMSCGEAWNNIMEDFATITYPNCVQDPKFFNSDCGSATWARILFISWNILSMYIFVSMFVSLIFESFSYVYQRSNGLSIVSREEIRRFKQAWATFDPEGTGFITKEAFPRLLGELSGVFEMRIYDGEHSVNRILEDCSVEIRGSETPAGVVHGIDRAKGIDLARLNNRISTINVPDIRRRRERMELFFQEIMVSANVDRGINFTSCLMILAHYNVISDTKSLRLEEFLRRRARLQRVEEEVRRRVVRGFFDTMYWSRLFRSRLDFRQSARMMTVPQFAVPEIFIDDQDVTDSTPYGNLYPPSPGSISPGAISPGAISPTDITRGRSQHDSGGLRHPGESRTGSPSRSDRSGTVTPAISMHRPAASEGSASFQWGADGTEEASQGGRSRAASSVDRQNVLDVFETSAWGESMRRSFTLRRSGTKGRVRAGGGGGHPGR